MLLNHLCQWWTYNNYSLMLLRHNSRAEIKYVYIDLSHQYLTQSNYLNDIVEVTNFFQVNNLMVYANEITPSLRANIPPYINSIFIDARQTPITNADGFQFYPLLEEFDENDPQPPYGYVPQLDGIVDIMYFESYQYNQC